MAIGIYGGSFDPIHLGHLITTQSIFEKRGLEKIIFIPSYISPLKQDSNALNDIHRLKMVQLAVEAYSYFEVSDYEIAKGDISYTIDTLIHFKKLHADIELIIGFDNLVVFNKWHRPEEIFDLAKVIVMMRNLDNVQVDRNRYFEKAILVDTPNIEIASSDIRKRIKENLLIDFLVPQKVSEYIYQHNFYR